MTNMRLVMRRVALVALVGLTLSSCDGDLLAPRHRPRGDAMNDARTPTATLTAVASASTRINLSWTDNSANETGWEIWRSSAGASGTFTLIASVGPNSTDYFDSGLAPSSTYCYQVRSFRKTGSRVNYDSFLGVACATTLPAPPAASNVDAGFGQNSWVLVTWTPPPPSASPNAIVLQRAFGRDGAWATIANVNATTPSFTDFNVAIEQLYCYRVSTVYTGDEGLSNVDCTARPAAPTNLVATAADAQSVDLHWADNSAVETQYEIQRSLDAVTAQTIATVAANVTTYHDGGLTANTRYWYRLRAVGPDATSPYSAWATVVLISDPPPAPTSVHAFPNGSTAVTVTWSPPTTASAFRVERSVDGQTTWQPAGATTDSYIADGQRTPEQEACYRVYASNSKGESTASQASCTRPPLAPTDIRITSQNDGSQLVSWTDNSNVEDGYEVSVWVFVYSCSPDFGCYYTCDNNGCYYATCDGSGCYPVQEKRFYALPANATSLLLDISDTFDAIYATRDGGESDPGTFAAGSTALSTAPPRTPSATKRLAPTHRLQTPSKPRCRTRRC